jgi:hypothetical protein
MPQGSALWVTRPTVSVRNATGRTGDHAYLDMFGHGDSVLPPRAAGSTARAPELTILQCLKFSWDCGRRSIQGD